MRIVANAADIEESIDFFMQRLRDETTAHQTSILWRGMARKAEVLWNARFGFWAAHRRTASRHAFLFGVADPACAGVLEPVWELSIPFSGYDERLSGALVRFGSGVMLASLDKPGFAGAAFEQFQRLHGHGLTAHELETPGGGTRGAHIVTGVTSPSFAYDILRFTQAVREHARWSALGLSPALRQKIQFHHKTSSDWPLNLRELVCEGVRSTLARHAREHYPKLRIGSAAGVDMVLATSENAALAAFQVKTSLAPEELHAGVGELLLSRATFRAAKFLVLPGSPGPFLSQALYRHDIFVAVYKLTQDMAVVLDAKAIFKAIDVIG
jgi:hypothetical protein